VTHTDLHDITTTEQRRRAVTPTAASLPPARAGRRGWVRGGWNKRQGQEFYQLLTYTDDVDLNAKLQEWEKFYNYGVSRQSH